MANYTAYIPSVGSTTYPTQISNFITISEAFDTEIEIARNGEANLLDGINLKLSLTGGTLTGGLIINTGNITVTTGNILIGTDTVAVKDAALTNGNIVSADSSGRVTTGSGISTNNIATLSGTQTITGNKTLSGINTISGINTFSARPAFNGGISGSTSPFTVDSTQVVINLNSDLLGGISATAFVRSDIADTINGIHTHTVRPVFNGGVSGSSSPFTVDSTQVVTNLNAELLGGQQGSYYAPINSPTLTGNPTAPTQASGNNSTRIATTAYVDKATASLNTKIIDIGDWNMDTTVLVTVAHGLDVTKIRSVSAAIRHDTSGVTDINYYDPSGTTNQGATCGATNVQLNRSTGGYFDNVNYDSTSFSRGWITIQYTD